MKILKIFLILLCCTSILYADTQALSIIGDNNIVKANFDITIADTAEKRATGLMYVKNMPKNQGMLFIFDQNRVVSMWMKNTYIPLDMLFIDEVGKITSIAHRTKPLSEKTISSHIKIRYVLEINAGLAYAYNIKVGDRIDVNAME